VSETGGGPMEAQDTVMEARGLSDVNHRHHEYQLFMMSMM